MNLVEFLQDLSLKGVKLWTEGGRLRIGGSQKVLTPDVTSQLQQYKTEILELLCQHPDTFNVYPLSYGQKALWFLWQLAPESHAYNVSLSVRICGAVDITAMEKVFQMLMERHPILRTTFPQRGSEPIQHVHQNQELDFLQIDASTWSEDQLKAKVVDAHQIRFDLETGPVMRVKWFTCSDKEHILLLTMHHIACDRWSFDILLQELPKIYQAQRSGIEISLLPLKHSYQDYVSWQRKILSSAQGEKLWSYWQQQLAGDLPTLDLATDKQRGPIQTYNGASYRFKLSKTLTEQVKKLAQREGVTFYTILLATFALLLHRYTGQEDILVGSPSLGRSQAEFAEIFGCFIDPVVIRANLSGNPSFKDFLKQVRQTVLEALTHQDYPFSLLVEKLQLHRDPSRPPIFQAFFALKQLQQSQDLLLLLENETEKNVDWGGMQLKPFEIPQQEGQFDLDFEIVESSSSVFGTFKYNTDLFEELTIERMAGHFQNLLSAIVGNPQQIVGELPLLSEAERHQLLIEWNHTESEYPIDQCIHQLFEEQVEKTPDALAVVFENHQLTYQQLNQRANQLARYLQSLGVGAERLVGICVERSIEMVVGILGILKAGAAYLPFDPDYPQERLSYMLHDSGVRILLTQESQREMLSSQQLEIVCLDTDWKNITAYSQQNLDTEVTSSNLAYVIYTSGSTGKPKGVTIEHRQVINFFTGIDDRIGNNSPGTWLALTTICFDISVLELFWTLARGFQVIIAPEQKKLFSSTTSKLQSLDKNIEFSLFYFASDSDQNSDQDKYKLLLEGAKFADRHGFSAIWTPERHFHQFGGLYPNPSVVSAAIAAITENIKIRAGSVVIPLHDPIRVAEEWAVVDNLSHGRVGISFATGWQPNDFILAPENYPQRKAVTLEAIETVRKLWRGETIKRRDGNGEAIEIKVLPRPLQSELPTWMTASGNPETFKLAGKLGVNVLTHLLGQTIEELGEKINLYRQAWREHGHSGNGHVTIMVHTYIGENLETVRQQVYQPLSDYLRSSLGLMKSIAVSMNQNPEDLSQADRDAMVTHAFNRYFETSGLLGTPEKCLQIINQLKAIDIDEVGCLIDFGVDVDAVISSLSYINTLKEDSNQKHISESDISSVSTQISKYNVSHLQCTPSLLKMLPDKMSSLKSLSKILVGGEELSVSLAKELSSVVSGEIYNMYGPTEATIWSTIHPVKNCDQKLSIGKPIINTQLYILDRNLQLVPIGVPGELYIGGNGLARGYLNRPELTKEKFIPNPFHNSKSERLYKTGDLVRYLPNGDIEYLGRIDNQVKVRGFRIELGEIEAVLNTHPQIQQAVVIATEETSGNKRLVAYVVLDEILTTQHLRQFLKQKLPEYMVPAVFITLDTLPLTPNGKLDRKALPAPDGVSQENEYVAPGTTIEKILTNIWQELLLKEKISIHDNFFEIGGDSILSIQLVSRAKNLGIQITAQQIFQNQTIAELAKVANTIVSAECEQGIVTGVALLSPIQHWFFSQNRKEAHHYNQSVLLEIPKNIKAEFLKKAVEQLLEHHDALRLRFSCVTSEYK
ncbi:LLM class flavin-dependent oxidoreductase, partial [Komarekiella sp. 'clone 1']